VSIENRRPEVAQEPGDMGSKGRPGEKFDLTVIGETRFHEAEKVTGGKVGEFVKG
jgi:hypothetical protein